MVLKYCLLYVPVGGSLSDIGLLKALRGSALKKHKKKILCYYFSNLSKHRALCGARGVGTFHECLLGVGRKFYMVYYVSAQLINRPTFALDYLLKCIFYRE